MNTITAGKLKDSGSPFRPMTEDERAYFKGVLTDVHEQFIEAVAAGRQLTVDEVRPLAEGRIYSGRQAKGLKLIDELGSVEAAVAEAGRLSGMTGTPEVKTPLRRRTLMQELFQQEEEMETEALTRRLRSVLGAAQQPALEYRAPVASP